MGDFLHIKDDCCTTLPCHTKNVSQEYGYVGLIFVLQCFATQLVFGGSLAWESNLEILVSRQTGIQRGL